MQAQRRKREQTGTEIAHGHICEIHPDKGFGRIEATNGRVIYFYEGSVTDRPFGELTTGTEVRFSEKSGARGPHAGVVEIID